MKELHVHINREAMRGDVRAQLKAKDTARLIQLVLGKEPWWRRLWNRFRWRKYRHVIKVVNASDVSRYLDP